MPCVGQAYGGAVIHVMRKCKSNSDLTCEDYFASFLTLMDTTPKRVGLVRKRRFACLCQLTHEYIVLLLFVATFFVCFSLVLKLVLYGLVYVDLE